MGAISVGEISLEQNSIGTKFRAPRAMGSALAKTRLLAVWLGADGFLPVWLPGADGFLPVWLPHWCSLAPMAGDPQRLATAGTTA